MISILNVSEEKPFPALREAASALPGVATQALVDLKAAARQFSNKAAVGGLILVAPFLAHGQTAQYDAALQFCNQGTGGPVDWVTKVCADSMLENAERPGVPLDISDAIARHLILHPVSSFHRIFEGEPQIPFGHSGDAEADGMIPGFGHPNRALNTVAVGDLAYEQGNWKGQIRGGAAGAVVGIFVGGGTAFALFFLLAPGKKHTQWVMPPPVPEAAAAPPPPPDPPTPTSRSTGSLFGVPPRKPSPAGPAKAPKAQKPYKLVHRDSASTPTRLAWALAAVGPGMAVGLVALGLFGAKAGGGLLGDHHRNLAVDRERVLDMKVVGVDPALQGEPHPKHLPAEIPRGTVLTREGQRPQGEDHKPFVEMKQAGNGDWHPVDVPLPPQ